MENQFLDKKNQRNLGKTNFFVDWGTKNLHFYVLFQLFMVLGTLPDNLGKGMARPVVDSQGHFKEDGGKFSFRTWLFCEKGVGPCKGGYVKLDAFLPVVEYWNDQANSQEWETNNVRGRIIEQRNKVRLIAIFRITSSIITINEVY